MAFPFTHPWSLLGIPTAQRPATEPPFAEAPLPSDAAPAACSDPDAAALRDPALEQLVDRVLYACQGYGFSRDDARLIIGEALWQAARLIRQGAEVEIPDLGTFRRIAVRGYADVVFFPHTDLLEATDA